MEICNDQKEMNSKHTLKSKYYLFLEDHGRSNYHHNQTRSLSLDIRSIAMHHNYVTEWEKNIEKVLDYCIQVTPY